MRGTTDSTATQPGSTGCPSRTTDTEPCPQERNNRCPANIRHSRKSLSLACGGPRRGTRQPRTSQKPPLTECGDFHILPPRLTQRRQAHGRRGATAHERIHTWMGLPRGIACDSCGPAKTCRRQGCLPHASTYIPAAERIRSVREQRETQGGEAALTAGTRQFGPHSIHFASDQSLPEKDGVLCPPGTRPFRGLFLREDVLRHR